MAPVSLKFGKQESSNHLLHARAGGMITPVHGETMHLTVLETLQVVKLSIGDKVTGNALLQNPKNL